MFYFSLHNILKKIFVQKCLDLDVNQIIEGCQRNDRHCQRELVERYSTKLMAICLRYAKHRMEAEDWLQDAFIKIFQSISTYRKDGSFEGWLRKITVYTCIRHIQKHSFQKEQLGLNGTETLDIEPEIYATLNKKDWTELIRMLPDGYRQIFNMHVIDGFSHKEIALHFNIEESHSRTKLTRAKAILRKKLLSIKKMLL